jgi:tRNA threonylcarbamoyladenosine biosynthesis protein TsaB
MRVLALDTTTRSGSVALVDDNRLIEERAGDPSRAHAERLPADLLDLIAQHGMAMSSIDLFAVASGPGSFTGLRIGIATTQGLASVHRRPVAAISALEALGHLGSIGTPRASLVGAWMDAHRGQVFSALYEIGDGDPFTAERLIELEGPSVAPPADTLARWQPRLSGRDVVLVGDGAVLYGAVASTAGAVLPTPLLAAAIAQIGVVRLRAGTAGTGAAIQPLYVRRPDAEIARDAERSRIAALRTPADHRR